MTTDNAVIMSGVEELPPIVCKQNSAKKVVPTEQDILNSIKNGFGEKIGAYTNKATTMEQMLCKFDKDSDEYKELQKRIRLCMHFQQCEIDRIKGVKSPPMPKEWYDYKTNMVNEQDSEKDAELKDFNMKILANKKSKFMIYIYDDLMKKYKKFIDVANKISITRYRAQLDDLMPETQEQIDFINKVNSQIPVENCDSLMNKICNIFEKEFDGVVKEKAKLVDFDHAFLIPDVKVSNSRKSNIEAEYKKYIKRVKDFMTNHTTKSMSDDEIKDNRVQFVNSFKANCQQICPSEKELTKILIELLYTGSKSKQFVWDIAGETIIENLLEHNGYNISFPQKSDFGDFEYRYEKYLMTTINLREE